MRRPSLFLLDEGEECLLTDRAESSGHLFVPAPVGGEPGQEGVNLRIGIGAQGGLEALAARPYQVHKQGQENHGEAADGHSVPEQFAPRPLKIFREDPVKLKRAPDPEREAHDHALPIVKAVLKEDMHAHDEEDGHQHDEVGRYHLTRYGDHNSHTFRQEGQHDEDDTHTRANRASRHSGNFGDRDTRRIRRVGHRAGETGEQIAQAIGSERTLNRTEVDGTRPAPRGPLDRNAVANRIECANERHHHERRQEGPEGRTEAEVEAGPCDGG